MVVWVEKLAFVEKMHQRVKWLHEIASFLCTNEYVGQSHYYAPE